MPACLEDSLQEKINNVFEIDIAINQYSLYCSTMKLINVNSSVQLHQGQLRKKSRGKGGISFKA